MRQCIEDTGYTEETIVQKAMNGCSLDEIMKIINDKRGTNLFSLSWRQNEESPVYVLPKATKKEPCIALARIRECFCELGLEDKIVECNPPKIYVIYPFLYTSIKYYPIEGLDDMYLLFEHERKSASTLDTGKISVTIRLKPILHRRENYFMSKEEVKAFIVAFGMSVSRWSEENIAIERNYNKINKAKSIAQTSIKIIVDDTFRDSGFEYKLHIGKKRNILTVAIGHQQKIEISLTDNNYQKKIDNLMDFLQKAAELTQTAPFYFRIVHIKETVKE